MADNTEQIYKNIDNLKEKCFLLLGNLNDTDIENPKWNKKFIDALMKMDQAMNVFKKQ